MGNFLMRLRNFFSGRNGIDKLNIALIVVYCVVVFIKTITRQYLWIGIIQYALLAYIVFRAMSRNLQKRYNENFKFEQVFKAWQPYFEHTKLRFQFRKNHRFRKCKNCGEFLRLKKGRGKRTVTCPKCGSEQKFHLL
ncbi:MAG: hypothetical protein LUH40_04100 [Clostridiales bacterium]|nr:hypothetical protein [Clostridiales bacterium]